MKIQLPSRAARLCAVALLFAFAPSHARLVGFVKAQSTKTAGASPRSRSTATPFSTARPTPSSSGTCTRAAVDVLHPTGAKAPGLSASRGCTARASASPRARTAARCGSPRATPPSQTGLGLPSRRARTGRRSLRGRRPSFTCAHGRAGRLRGLAAPPLDSPPDQHRPPELETARAAQARLRPRDRRLRAPSQDGTWRLWYNNERDKKSIYFADSPDLKTWPSAARPWRPGRRRPQSLPLAGRVLEDHGRLARLAVYRSDDALKWTRQAGGNLLEQRPRRGRRGEGRPPRRGLERRARIPLLLHAPGPARRGREEGRLRTAAQLDTGGRVEHKDGRLPATATGPPIRLVAPRAGGRSSLEE